MFKLNVIDYGILYENPLPQLRSRNGYFPSIVVLDDGTLLASFAVGEAFESVDLTTVLSKSSDEGKTWTYLGPIYDKSRADVAVSDFFKITNAGGGRLIAFGYEYLRENSELPIGNPETGGVLESRMVFLESFDEGNTWDNISLIPSTFAEPIEASAPITVLKNGTLVSPIANFFNWDGQCSAGLHGRLLRTEDEGKTWDDSVITMEFPGRNTAIWEQRLCELENGNLILIAWNEVLETGERLPNHYVISKDGGRSFNKPLSTGIMGQASNIMHIGDNKVLALHCIRRDTDRPGIYGYIVDLAKGKWDILSKEIIWEPQVPVKADNSMAAVFAFLKFGQPSAVKLKDGNYLITNWFVEDGRGKIAWHRLKIED